MQTSPVNPEDVSAAYRSVEQHGCASGDGCNMKPNCLIYCCIRLAIGDDPEVKSEIRRTFNFQGKPLWIKATE